MVRKSGIEDMYVIKNNKKLRFGYTTGSCAAAAGKAAAYMLLKKEVVEVVELLTPKGILLHLDVLDIKQEKESVTCAIQKDAGDDPDVTDKLLIYASVRKTEEPGITILGGAGVGKVTKSGLEQAIGDPAINKVPRSMIRENIQMVCQEVQYQGGIEVTISVPGGEETAKRTFNPRLGIIGGISILGTTGIVEPMSEAALIASIKSEMAILKANGNEYLLITPGNYGQEYVKNEVAVSLPYSLKCSNYIGETIDIAINLEVKGILFISHIGKFIKVAGGIMNTHSRNADARAELMAANAIAAGAGLECIRKILESITTDEAIGVLEEAGLVEPTMEQIIQKIKYYLNRRGYDRLEIGAVIFSNVYGELAQTDNVPWLLEKITENHI
jgi:cobalt-precorrin-5B (C1)-methyltransferase